MYLKYGSRVHINCRLFWYFLGDRRQERIEHVEYIYFHNKSLRSYPIILSSYDCVYIILWSCHPARYGRRHIIQSLYNPIMILSFYHSLTYDIVILWFYDHILSCDPINPWSYHPILSYDHFNLLSYDHNMNDNIIGWWDDTIFEW